MSTNHSHPPRRNSAPRATTTFQPTEASRIVWLRIAFSGRFASPHEDIERRLGLRLRRSGRSDITCWMTDRALLLLGCDRPITPADWSNVIGWLLCQPEVVFVAREQPQTQRIEVHP